ncbi:polysaccharide deacetylase family protein [Geomicrobium sp. JCM 19039]|uniref:polysaccharide deacetylase family protein n=1 Tax=Geomicrobium sp. JCM 19039 TaxID=1460636 RepID=UPI00045F1273|nr:polysaccharide deacetylase family protein [Geomicrobium sp. JCM 19039]GAK14210.1 polysaccharide deacetylase [Geomicrobium sp. JCM 19039]
MRKPKRMLALGAASALLLAACADDTEQAGDENVEAEGTEEPTFEDDDEAADDEEDELPEEDDEDETEDDEEDIEEDVEIRYEVNPTMYSIDPIDDAPEDVVLITIDDGPKEYSLEMAELLHEHDIQAIFFVNGMRLTEPEEQEELLQIEELGHAIGNHTYGHPSLPELSEEEQREEIVGVNDQIEEITGERPDFFRAPFGQNTEYSWQLLEEEGMVGMNWTFGFDWEADYIGNAEKFSEDTLNAPELGAGANILMHDLEHTNDALEDIIIGLEEQGYGFVNPHEIKIENIDED